MTEAKLPALQSLKPSSELCEQLATRPRDEVLADLSRAELALLRANAPALIAQAKRTATQGEVERVLAPLVAVFGVSEAAKSTAFWRAYHQVLGTLHPEALERAAGKWLEVGKYFPKPAELREIAQVQALDCVRVAELAHAALSFRPPANRIAVDLGEVVKPRSIPAAPERVEPIRLRPSEPHPLAAPPLPSIAGKTDETGLTSQMRMLLERRRA